MTLTGREHAASAAVAQSASGLVSAEIAPTVMRSVAHDGRVRLSATAQPSDFGIVLSVMVSLIGGRSR